jgi:SAM-dependent methyltransferase
MGSAQIWCLIFITTIVLIEVSPPCYYKSVTKLLDYFWWQVSRPVQFNSENSKHLDLGAGTNFHNPFGASLLYAGDLFKEKPKHFDGIEYQQTDLTKSLPFETNSFDSVSCFDVLEHIPRWERSINGDVVYPFINLMSEINRILKPGGYLYAYTPAFPSPAAFQDPTHINIISVDTITYFLEPNPYAASYGFSGCFKLVHQAWVRGVGPTTTRLPSPNFSSVDGFLDLLRFSIRCIRAVKNRNPSHLLWVLKK